MSLSRSNRDWECGDQVTARYDFVSQCPEDLAFSRSDTLTIVSATRDSNWYVARRDADRCEGMVPSNYVQSRVASSSPMSLPATTNLLSSRASQTISALNHTMSWFHGKISRERAEELLMPREDGLYLVRESTNFPGDYTLCVSYENGVEHYRIMNQHGKLSIDEEVCFPTLHSLVQHYEQDADGLCTQLKRCVVCDVGNNSISRQIDNNVNSKSCSNDLNLGKDEKLFQDAGWLIDRNNIQLKEKIGCGEFGEVMLAEYRPRGDQGKAVQLVAVKIILASEGHHTAQHLLSEATVMTSLRHPNLAQLIGVVIDQQTIFQVMEYLSKGSLVEYLRSRGQLHITLSDQIKFACDTCNGMSYLESQHVVHRDLAARNVLLDDLCTAKISDFGLARCERAGTEKGRLPVKWTAPEALKHGIFSSKTDVWSFGILLWEIYSFGRAPYPRLRHSDVVKSVASGYRMEAPDHCPSDIYDIMIKTWDTCPDNRPTFATLASSLYELSRRVAPASGGNDRCRANAI